MEQAFEPPPAQHSSKPAAKNNKKRKVFALLLVLLILGAVALAYCYKVGMFSSYRAQFTTAIKDREPVDKIVAVKKIKDGRITFFTEFTDRKGQTVYHVWKKGDKVIYKHSFVPTSDKWRGFSDVSQGHYVSGDKAVVEIQDKDHKVLSSYSIKVE